MSLVLTPDQFDYYLPEGLIAQNPSEERDQSRLMLLDRLTGQFKHSIDYIEKIKNHSDFSVAWRCFGYEPKSGNTGSSLC